MKNDHAIHIRWLNAIAEVAPEHWDAMAVPLKTPLLEWHWLHHLEASGSISPEHGWQPRHLTMWEGPKLIAAAPLYIKSHSDGEFTFDHWLAHLSKDYGIDYYPKMVGMSPATPAVGYRFLVAQGVDQDRIRQEMLAAIDHYCRNNGITGCHLNFVDMDWFSQWRSDQFTAWEHQSYLWENRNFSNFDDYLKCFKSSQRRNIRRERNRMGNHDIEIKAHTGEEIAPEMADIMYQYYLRTNARYGPWAARYLNGRFFKRVFQDWRHRMLIIAASTKTSPNPVALSMLLVKERRLLGRYWGCAAHIKDLHFNMCFYAPIKWAIENGIRTFDPGAGSAHKIQRGFQAVVSTSLHRFYDQRLDLIFRHLIGEVNRMEHANIDALNQHLPFARTNHASTKRVEIT